MSAVATAPLNIHEKLATLWETEGKDKTLARLFNFIIATQKSERTSYYKDLIKKVVAKFPSRIIFLIENETSSESYLTTEVFGETVSEGIYCELIQVEAGGQQIEQLPFLVLPYIVPDLPLYLLWTKPLLEKSPLFSFVEPFTTRIIFDSDAAANLNHYSSTLLSFIDHYRCDIGDLNWTALSGWRQIFFKVFDHPDTVEHLNRLSRLEITYNRIFSLGKNSEIKAIYLQGWLGAQLHWRFKNCIYEGNGKFQLHYTNTKGLPLTVFLTPTEETHLPNGTLLSVDIETTLNKGHFAFKRDPASRHVFVQCSDAASCDLPHCLSLSGLDPGKEIAEEIFYGNMTSHYKNMLTFISSIPWPK